MTVSRTLYVNGHFVAEHEAQISVFDRGFLFSDAVYEVTAVVDKKLIDFQSHMARLRRSLSELSIEFVMTDEELLELHRLLIKKNELIEGGVYLQISRGVAERNFIYDNKKQQCTVVAFTQVFNLQNNPIYKTGLKVISQPDLRWGRRDIKTVQLLYSSLIKTQAKQQGVDDAWLVNERGEVNEGTSSNVWLVDQHNRLVTPALSRALLSGITRSAVHVYAQQAGIEVVERAFTIEEVWQAKEAFVTSASSFVTPVVEVDGKKIGDGKPGNISQQLLALYIKFAQQQAI